jgi:hypothetical protein
MLEGLSRWGNHKSTSLHGRTEQMEKSNEDHYIAYQVQFDRLLSINMDSITIVNKVDSAGNEYVVFRNEQAIAIDAIFRSDRVCSGQ